MLIKFKMGIFLVKMLKIIIGKWLLNEVFNIIIMIFLGSKKVCCFWFCFIVYDVS